MYIEMFLGDKMTYGLYVLQSKAIYCCQSTERTRAPVLIAVRCMSVRPFFATGQACYLVRRRRNIMTVTTRSHARIYVCIAVYLID